ncbi:hypothetical protein BD311DRAFT_809835 [Dichomitus squalens]|uniref:Hydrophobin n=1 Tax=Dichomitus squalens TaxID=114155 RepID=A0A4Q9MBF2_9APHY|nr:hypothetical protein BD311DRAFT_809835 [Dichomitus squalens]TBU60281.1 hypothetical protein BD310DRAFT_905460 [Dichomitus squalens]
MADFIMRFTALASIVLAAASAGLVNAATLEQRQLGSCSSSSLGLPLPLCGAVFGDCSGAGCECTELTSQIIGTIPGLSNVLDILDATGLDIGTLGICTTGGSVL